MKKKRNLALAIITIITIITIFAIAIIDFIGVFVGFLIVVTLVAHIKKIDPTKKIYTTSAGVTSTVASTNSQDMVNVICPNCKKELSKDSKFCNYCGTVIPENNNLAAIDTNSSQIIQIPTKVKCSKCGNEMAIGNVRCTKCGTAITQEDTITSEVEVYNTAKGQPINKAEYEEYLTTISEDKSLKDIVTKELSKTGEYKYKTLPLIEKRKTILTIIYTIIMFIITTIFFLYHSSSLNYINVIGVIITIVYIIIYKKYNLVSHLTKEIKSRPDEKINYIVSSTLSGTTNNAQRNNNLRTALIIAVIVIQIGIYWEPHLIFERYNEGYAVRYYTYGIMKKDIELTIPSDYKGKEVISIRGDVFENSNSLEKVSLPETIQEIRGGAFKYCKGLREINIPSKVTEIRGNTFEGCSSLSEIVIPEGVTRIGGSAFRDCTDLANVTIPETVTEIGSSAFRNTKISTVCISVNAYVNERAFKETYPEIQYYENGCGKNEYNDYNDYREYDYDYYNYNKYNNYNQ